MAGENYSYTTTPNAANPGSAQTPFQSWNNNPLGSQFAATYGYDTTDMMQQDLERAIFDAIPERFRAGIRMFLDRPVTDKNLREFSWKERVYGRMPLKANATATAGATHTITLTAGGGKLVTINKLITYPNGTKGIVTAIPGTDQITVKAANGGGTLPAVAANDYFQVSAPLIGDGGNMAYHYDRNTFITRRNYIQFSERNKRWTRAELQEYQNSGTTDMLNYDKQQMMELAMEDIFISLWDGTMAEYDITLPNGTVQSKARTTQGIYRALIAAGAQHMTSTSATFASDFSTLCFATNAKSSNSVRYLFATPQLFYKLDGILKDPIRYTPSDQRYDMNLMQYDIGGMTFVKVPIPVFAERGLFGADWANRLFCLDMANISTVKLKGYDLFELGETPDKKGGTSLQDYKDWWLHSCYGMEFKDPTGSFYMDLTGL